MHGQRLNFNVSHTVSKIATEGSRRQADNAPAFPGTE
jgi:hypothetical protein